MAESKVKVGMIYSAKVGGTYLSVRIDKSLGHGRYQGASLPSGAKVTVTTAVIKGDGQTPEQWKERNTPKEAPPAQTPKDTAADVGTGAKSNTRAKREPGEKKPRKPSGLDAAVAVLAEAGKPLNTTDMVKRMLETGMWQTGGKTPAATIYAAIITEISKKGEQSRFRKVDRGLFELTPVGITARTEAGKAGN